MIFSILKNRIRASGSFYILDHNKFEETIRECVLNNPNSDIILDLSECTSLSSLGLGLILKAAVDLLKTGNKLVVENPNTQVKTLLNLSNVSSIIDII